MIAVIVILLILAVIVGGAAYYYFTQMESESSVGPSPGPSGGSSTSTLTITENGATLTENYRIMPRREKYIQAANVMDCYISVPGLTRPEYCGLHDRSTDGFAYSYDLSLIEPTYSECPGGGHECWYKEKFDQNGNLVDIIDKNGVKLLDKLADDIWADKWDMNTPNIAGVLTMAEYKDKKLIALEDMYKMDGTFVRSGNEITINDTPNKSVYLILLMIAMKIAGQPKPGRIVLNVAGGKASFDTFITLREQDQARQASQASHVDGPQ